MFEINCRNFIKNDFFPNFLPKSLGGPCFLGQNHNRVHFFVLFCIFIKKFLINLPRQAPMSYPLPPLTAFHPPPSVHQCLTIQKVSKLSLPQTKFFGCLESSKLTFLVQSYSIRTDSIRTYLIRTCFMTVWF